MTTATMPEELDLAAYEVVISSPAPCPSGINREFRIDLAVALDFVKLEAERRLGYGGLDWQPRIRKLPVSVQSRTFVCPAGSEHDTDDGERWCKGDCGDEEAPSS